MHAAAATACQVHGRKTHKHTIMVTVERSNGAKNRNEEKAMPSVQRHCGRSALACRSRSTTASIMAKSPMQSEAYGRRKMGPPRTESLVSRLLSEWRNMYVRVIDNKFSCYRSLARHFFSCVGQRPWSLLLWLTCASTCLTFYRSSSMRRHACAVCMWLFFSRHIHGPGHSVFNTVYVLAVVTYSRGPIVAQRQTRYMYVILQVFSISLHTVVKMDKRGEFSPN